MEAEIEPCEILTPHQVRLPSAQTLPLVFASPHSGRHYPPAFVASARLDRVSLRRSEDGFVDELIAAAPEMGAPLLQANFPRAYVDVNREPFELDPRMFNEPLPGYANTRSPRVAAGLGTIARVVASGSEIYSDKLTFAEALSRIRAYYWPYHNALSRLIADTRERFGACILVDCHSMPSIGGPMDRDAGRRRVDFVLGDSHGAACDPRVPAAVETALTQLGYNVRHNSPYSGGFVTRHYGRPWEGVHALQIEMNRALYMDEETVRRGPGLAQLAHDMRAVVAALGELEPARF
ncbi:N-formylglutamate amidohydrolase [Limimonas halophila]|nr:N-formylglutamate amidohydrolase [Limimonas halophila]